MIREFRYYVFKAADVKKYLNYDEQHMLNELGIKITAGRIKEGKLPYNGVVVDQDWPEFETVWAMIEARMDGVKLPVSPRMERLMGLACSSIEECKAERDRSGKSMTDLDIFKWHVRDLLRKYPRSLLSSSATREERSKEGYGSAPQNAADIEQGEG